MLLLAVDENFGASVAVAARPASLHVNVLAVDRNVALVGSANVTNSAVVRNLECGVLVRDPAIVADLAGHVAKLVRAGDLVCEP